MVYLCQPFRYYINSINDIHRENQLALCFLFCFNSVMKNLILIVTFFSNITLMAGIDVVCRSNWGIFDTLVLKEEGSRVKLRIEAEEGRLEVQQFLKRLGIEKPTAKILTAEFNRDACKSLDEISLVHRCTASAIAIKVEGDKSETYLFDFFDLEIKHSRVRSVSVDEVSAIVAIYGHRRVGDQGKSSSMIAKYSTVGEMGSCRVP